MGAHRPDRLVGALSGIVSIAYFGLLILALVLLFGLPAAKVLAGEDTEWVIGLPVPVASIASDVVVLTRWGDARLEVENMRGSLRLPIRMLPWALFAVLWIYVASAATLMLGFLHHFRRIIQRVRKGAPFDEANALRLRWLGLLTLAFALLNGITEFVTSLVVRDGVVGGHVRVPLGLSVDGSLVIFGLVLLALAAIFRRGAELEAEQALTI